jgi:hypothetical protein
MSFLRSFVSVSMKNVHDGAIKTLASWDPETVGESQIAEWNAKAVELATMAVKAAEDRDTQRTTVATMVHDVDRYTAASEKLAETNPDAANQAADKALSIQEELKAAQETLADAESWANTTRTTAEDAQAKVTRGRKAIEKAKRDGARASQERTVAETRLHDRERLAGITKGLDGTDVAINAIASNTADDHRAAEAAKLRTGVLNKGADADDAINAALAAVEAPKVETLTEKLARIKAAKG